MRTITYIPIALALLLTILLLGGCKKSTVNKQNLVQGSISVVRSANGNTVYDTIAYSYNSQGWLTIVRQGNGSAVATWSYTPNTATFIQGTDTAVYQLNNQGLAISDNTGYVYTFDNNGYCTSAINATSGVTTIYTVSGGNILTQQTTVAGSTSTYVCTFLSTPDNRNYGEPYFGKRDVNLVNTETVTTAGTSTTYNFTYTFDSQGRVQSSTTTNGSSSETISYSYED